MEKVNHKFLILSLPCSYSKSLEYSQNNFLQLVCSVRTLRRSMCYVCGSDSKSLLIANSIPSSFSSRHWLIDGTRSVWICPDACCGSPGPHLEEGRRQPHSGSWLLLWPRLIPTVVIGVLVSFWRSAWTQACRPLSQHRRSAGRAKPLPSFHFESIIVLV